jgi:hypothetical protein
MIFKWLRTVSDEHIINSIDPWTLACAVGAENGTGGRRYGFNMWYRHLHKDQLLQVSATLGVTERRIKKVLKRFATQNNGQHMNSVLQELRQKRGMSHDAHATHLWFLEREKHRMAPVHSDIWVYRCPQCHETGTYGPDGTDKYGHTAYRCSNEECSRVISQESLEREIKK